jgi:hypothetical protein
MIAQHHGANPDTAARFLQFLRNIRPVPHPFRFFLRKGWDANRIQDYTICENALAKARA